MCVPSDRSNNKCLVGVFKGWQSIVAFFLTPMTLGHINSDRTWTEMCAMNREDHGSSVGELECLEAWV